MRSADASTVLRIGAIFLVLYLVIIKVNPIISIILLAFAFVLDGVDGFLALRETSKGKISLKAYIDYSLGSKKLAKTIKKLKEKTKKNAKYGPRFDVAGDRIVEYSLWAVFTVIGILPLFVLIIIIIRHSIADAFLGERGTSSKMSTGIARKLYASNLSRSAINVLKFITFSYLILAYVSGYPLWIAYVLVTALVLYIVVRGTAEVYESFNS